MVEKLLDIHPVSLLSQIYSKKQDIIFGVIIRNSATHLNRYFETFRGSMEAIENKTDNRFETIIRYNIIGIAINLVLSTAKIIIGFVTNAHAVILDGIEPWNQTVFQVFRDEIAARPTDGCAKYKKYGQQQHMAVLIDELNESVFQ